MATRTISTRPALLNWRRRQRLGDGLIYVLLVILAFTFIFPILFMVTASFKANESIL
jgi:ABC-type glycerol-3-phosphate transport system permease component